MIKKIFSRLLMGAVAAVTLSTSFVSCKDYDEDLYVDLQKEINDRNATLQSSFDAQIAALKARLDAIEADTAKWNAGMCHCGDINEILEGYWNIDSIKNKLSAYYTQEEIVNMFKNYYMKDSIDSLRNLYYTQTAADAKFATYNYITNMMLSYWNKTQVDSFVNEKLGNYLTEKEIENLYYNKHEIDSMLEKYVTLEDLLNALGFSNAGSTTINIADSIKKALQKYVDGRIAELGLSQFASKAAIDSLRQRVESLEASRTAMMERDDSIVKAISEINMAITAAVAKAEAADSLAQVALDKAILAAGVADSALKLAGANTKKIETIIQDLVNVKQTLADHESRIQTLEDFKTAWGPRLTEIADSVQNNWAEIQLLKQWSETVATKDMLNGFLKAEDLQDIRDSLANIYTIAQNNLDAVKIYVDNQIMLVTAQLANYATKEEVQALADQLANFATKEEVEALKTLINEKANQADLTALDTKVGQLEDAYKAADKAMQDQLDDLKPKVEANTKSIETINTKIQDLTGRVDQLEQKVENIINRIDGLMSSMVTSIIVEGAHSSATGYFNTPVGLKSNVLVGFYGEAQECGVQIPTSNSSYSNNDPSNVFTAADMQVINQYKKGSTYLAGAKYPLVNSDKGVDMGTVYLTVNPAETNFAGQTVKMVNSQGQECGTVLDPLAETDYTLTFGVSRASGTGFYAANAYVPVTPEDRSNIDKSRIYISQELKSAVKENLRAFKNTRKVSFSNLTSLAKGIYDQAHDIAPAQAIKATWKDEATGKQYNVMSGYNLLSTAVQPLSYVFLKGVDMTKYQIPHPVSPLDDIDLNKYLNINFVGVQPINVDTMWVEVSMDTTMNIKQLIEFDHAIYYTFTGKDTVYYNSPDEALDENGNVVIKKDSVIVNVQGEIVDTIHLEYQFDKDVKIWITRKYRVPTEKFEDAINEQLENINGQVEDVINDIKTGLSKANKDINKYIDKVNKFINRVNSFVDRVNKYISNPNKYLQPIMLYNTADGGLKMLSEVKVPASPFKVAAGGDKAIVLRPTSYTAELLAPSFKKFIVVTNVWDENGSNTSAKAKAALAKANGAEFMATVLEGRQNEVAFVTNSAYAGCTYEIAYQTVDYQGMIVTKKFYLKVQ